MALYVKIDDAGRVTGFKATKSRDDPPPGGETPYRVYAGAATAIFPLASLFKAAPELVKIQRESHHVPREETLQKLAKLAQDFGIDIRVVKDASLVGGFRVVVADLGAKLAPLIIYFVDP